LSVPGKIQYPFLISCKKNKAKSLLLKTNTEAAQQRFGNSQLNFTDALEKYAKDKV